MSNLVASWAHGPMIAFDLETTDVDPHRDRIVTAAVIAIVPTGPGQKPQVDLRTWLADPQVEIPAAATAKHGITTEHARAHGRQPAEVIAEIGAHLARIWTATVPLVAFNAPFDLTMLDAELRRHHSRGLDLSGPVIDPICIDRHLHPAQREEKRSLTNLCKVYGVRLDQAHNSTDDALAAARLAWQLAKDQPERIGQLAPHVLHSRQAQWFREQQDARVEMLERKLWGVPRGDTARIERLQRQISDTRASGKSWPLLPETVAAARRVLPPRPGGPARSHASWTPDLEAALREQWLAADPAAAPTVLHDQLAEQYGRTAGAIRSRLIKLHCDIDVPGQACTAERAAELKARLDAEYTAARS
ncbi:DNA polymerase III subunit epsilon [Amycolatopsis sp. WAC 04197]|uniref:exonuclease domain-containing protein n=1 Tax=Amycolatopsis sp. WAC 04197 TaxID=2203199 RepID=UPI000F7AD32E|nr:exonuclease domain-containing protein [Amycolatopsis sp. WAC 04197]RSN44900.1 DNA polymerase III subunit epsilon [Amycolatopsis sp. WAC 04197]